MKRRCIGTLMFAALALAAGLLADHSLAQDRDYAAPYKARCADGPQQQMNACLKGESEQVERRLTDAMSRLTDVLLNPAPIQEAQATWQRFREQECAFAVSGLEPGQSLYPYALLSCRIDLAERRIRDLQGYLQDECNGCPTRRTP